MKQINISYNFNKSPCMNCKSRYIGCHGNCDMYINWNNERLNTKSEIYKEKYRDSEINSYLNNKSNRLKKKD